MAGGVRIGRATSLRPNRVITQHTTDPLSVGMSIPDKTSFQKVVEHVDEHILAAKEKKKAHDAQDKAAVAPVNENVEEGDSNQALQSDGHVEDEVAHTSEPDDNEVNSPHSE
nr:hypothetical protein [Tanacetum cinerariifolium]